MDPSNFFVTEAYLALGEARRKKAERTKDQGSPINLSSKAIKIEIRGDSLWTAESGGLARKYSLETGKLQQTFRGHTGPVTCLAFFPSSNYLFTGSWDNTIKVWDTSGPSLLSSTNAHSDFLKCLLVLPSMNILVSGGSDKAIRIWNLEKLGDSGRISQIGSLSGHTRPVECLSFDADNSNATSSVLFSADSMGVIKVWRLDKEVNPETRCRAVSKFQLNTHSTGINDMWFGLDQLWTASTDCTVLVHVISSDGVSEKSRKPLRLRKPANAILPLALTIVNEPLLIVGSGEDIISYDMSCADQSEEKGMVDGHWHDITALRLWIKKANTPSGFEPVIVSASLDGSVRRWSLKEISSHPRILAKPKVKEVNSRGITDAELDELLGTDEE